MRLLAFGVLAVVLLSVVAVAAGALALPDGKETGETGRERAAPVPTPVVEADRVPDGGLLPDLASLPAEELSISGRGERRVLRFAAVLVNTGAGPLQVDPVPVVDCPPGQRLVVQTVYVDDDLDGAFDREQDRSTHRLPGGCMLFHAAHEHWHFDGSARYALTEVDDTEPIVARKKVSFCLRDSERNPAASERDRKAYPSCARNRRQGISVGWADRYDASLPGQRLVLPADLADGAYCLRLRADPFGQLAEVDETDNESAVVIRINGRQVARDPAGACTP